MESWLWFFATIAVAALGGAIGHRLKLPAGTMLGAMVATVGLNLVTGRVVFYTALRVAIQILAGAMLGGRMNRATIREMKRLVVPIAILVAGMFVLNVLSGSAIYLLSSLDPVTAFFASTPGGASDMAIIAEDLGADPSHVAVLQLSRLLTIYTCMPFVIRRYVGSKRELSAAVEAHQTDGRLEAQGDLNGHGDHRTETPADQDRPSVKDVVGVLAFSTACGLVFRYLGVSAGAFVGGMVGGTIYSLLRGEVALPRHWRRYMQTGSGAFIGVKVGMDTILALGDLGIPLAIMVINVLISSFGLGYLIHKLTRLDHLTCILAAAPGGRQEMSYLSEDLGADTSSIVVMQTVRMIFVIGFFPALLTGYHQLLTAILERT